MRPFLAFPVLFFLLASLAGCGVTVIGGGDDEDFDSAEFEVSGSVLVMTGGIDDDTADELDEALDENPAVNTLLMKDVPGSLDDEATLVVSRKVRARALTTYVPSDGRVAGEAIKVYLAGVRRIAQRGARFGVKSWKNDDDQAGIQLAVNDQAHGPRLAFYRELGIPEEFYWFTLRAAPPEGMYWMTESELTRFQVVTEFQ